MRPVLTLAVVVVLGWVLFACGASEPRDASANLACAHFHNTAVDAPTLTRAELRTKFREVYDDAKLSEDPDLAGASEDALTALTEGDQTAFDMAVRRMSAACDAYRD